MDIGTPLKTLEIIGNDTTSILKANHSEMLNKGTREFILSVREDIFTNRSFKLPEDWDTSWDIKLGPIWTPAELDSTYLACWLLPEYLNPSASDADICVQANDRSGNGVVWENTNTEASNPTFTPELNGFKGMEFADTQYLYSLDESGDGELDPGTGDFAITMLVEFGTIGTSEKHVLCSDSTRDFALSVREESGNDSYKVYFNGSATKANATVDQTQPLIMTIGRSGGDQFMRHASISVNDPDITGTETVDIDNSQQFFIGAREHATADRLGITGFTGDIYEITFYNGTLSDDDRQSIEGYLAHKYAVTSYLHNDHPYKTNPPRAGTPA
jgi:hypothetical protein